MSFLPRRPGHLAACVVAALFASEAGLRLWDAARGRRTGSLYEFVVPFGTRFKMRPDTTVVVPERYGDVEYSFNHLGYRDRDHVAQADRRPLLLLGDSVSFGLGVARERTYAALLERATGEEVVNLAMWAYDTCDERAALEADGLRVRPRVAVIQFFMNDLAAAPALEQRPALRDRLVAARNRLLYSSNLWRRGNQILGWLEFTLLHDLRRRRFPETLNAAEPRGQMAFLAAHPEDDTIPAFTCLAGIAREVRASGADVLVLSSPAEPQLYDDRYDAIDARLARFCGRHGLAFVDALPALRAAPHREGLFLDGVHLSVAGHEQTSTLLLKELARLTGTPQ
jgi:lysophospholipase L1-like esterase